jgi:cold-inducible RNA-binding protein
MENNTKLYVGGLAYACTNEDLESAFGAVAAVKSGSASVITDRETGRSRGFGFIEMETAEGAEQAISQLHDQEILGRRVSVNLARPKTDRPPQRDEGFNRW